MKLNVLRADPAGNITLLSSTPSKGSAARSPPS